MKVIFIYWDNLLVARKSYIIKNSNCLFNNGDMFSQQSEHV